MENPKVVGNRFNVVDVKFIQDKGLSLDVGE